MRTLKEENRYRMERIDKWEQEKAKTGVACDACGEEMHFCGIGILATIPSRREVMCPNCHHRDILIIG